ncbi:glutamate--cysteine ligase [Flagellatimonas centrodinii]|uniref:glutamate--cysteine ligase n=1 Tax=Flagellatimonas centrodinii TaxID=2806210 RepID=UPI001FF03A0E|nr:glutamate--cysteine ligase [Flagellatimonas centrodinii]ULQ45526.1 glutamate--cysteine ligase [Flagellatimonas centrodinii]
MQNPVPRLATAHTGPLLSLETRLLERTADIEAWFRRQWVETPPPFYSSVDLRNAGYKLAPVDTNLFPGGFNNLNATFEPLCVQALKTALLRVCPSAQGLILVPENHTRNKFYMENVATLFSLIQKAGYRVHLGSLLPDLSEPREITLELSGRKLLLEPLVRDGDQVRVGDFTPCAVLLNNDLSAGVPPILQNLRQDVLPPVGLGWHARKKSQHFGFYRETARELAAVLDIDPWLIDPMFRNCGQINFMKREGEECLVSNVELMLNDLRAKYREYEIPHEPFVIIKSDAGTYGMGVMTARSADDVREMNRRARSHMASAKDGSDVTGAIIQEGVPTFERVGAEQAAAEPVVYMIDQFVVGGFYRLNSQRGNDENLNAPGMRFEQLAFDECCGHPDLAAAPDAQPNRFYAYGVIARLAALAAAREVTAVTSMSATAAAA